MPFLHFWNHGPDKVIRDIFESPLNSVSSSVEALFILVTKNNICIIIFDHSLTKGIRI